MWVINTQNYHTMNFMCVLGQVICLLGPWLQLSHEERESLSFFPYCRDFSEKLLERGGLALDPWLNRGLNAVSKRQLVCLELGAPWFIIVNPRGTCSTTISFVSDWQPASRCPPVYTVRARLQPTRVCLMMIMALTISELTLSLLYNFQPNVTLVPCTCLPLPAKLILLWKGDGTPRVLKDSCGD